MRCRLVPFLPLEQPHVVEVIVDLLQKRAARETAAGNMAKLSWTSDVPTWLAAKARGLFTSRITECVSHTPELQRLKRLH